MFLVFFVGQKPNDRSLREFLGGPSTLESPIIDVSAQVADDLKKMMIAGRGVAELKAPAAALAERWAKACQNMSDAMDGVAEGFMTVSEAKRFDEALATVREDVIAVGLRPSLEHHGRLEDADGKLV